MRVHVLLPQALTQVGAVESQTISTEMKITHSVAKAVFGTITTQRLQMAIVQMVF